MASSKITLNKCATCIKKSDEKKVKPGITLCEGCHQTFCLSHFVEHRQTLNNTLDDIAGQRDILRSRIEELPTTMSKEHFQVIDDWQNTMLQTVTEAANNARQQVHQLIISEMERECGELTSKITSFRINDDYFETDIEKLQVTIEKLNKELKDLSGLHRIQLNLPTLDCSNMVHIKPFETHSLPEITKNNDSIMSESKEYRSFVERFLTTHQPSTNIEVDARGFICASPTMLIDATGYNVTRFVFYRESRSTFDWKHGSVLDMRWSSWLQQFIVLLSSNIVAVDAVEKESKEVVHINGALLQCMAHWKHLCLIADDTKRVFLYEMNKNLADWFLLYCWSAPTTCAFSEKITAIGLNGHHIVLSVKRGDRHRFTVYNHDMKHCSHIQLTHPCTTIQALPQDEWLLYNSSQQFYYVIDSELKQHGEPYLSSLKDFELIISCEETDKVLLVLLSRPPTTNSRSKRRIIVYTNDCLL